MGSDQSSPCLACRHPQEHAQEGPLDGVKIMRSDSDKFAIPAKVGVKLVLKVNEALVTLLGERLLEAEDRASKEGPDGGDCWGDLDSEELGGLGEGV